MSGSDDNTIRIWNAESGSAVGKPLKGHTGLVWSITYSPDGCHIISGSLDDTVRMWNVETGSAVGKPLEGHTDMVMSVAYSPNGRYIISGSADKTIRIWDAETGSAVRKPLKGHTHWVWSVAYSLDGHHIASGSEDKTIRIWNAKTGSPVGKPFEGHTEGVMSVAYSPDGRYIISGSADKTIRVWNAETRSPGVQSATYASHYWSVPAEPTHQAIHLSDPVSIQTSSAIHPMSPELHALPDAEGWVRDPEGGLLYWVPADSRIGLHSPALLTIPRTSPIRSVSLNFNEFVFGTSWTRVSNTVPT